MGVRGSSNLIKSLESIPQNIKELNLDFKQTPLSNKIFRNKQAFLINAETVPFDKLRWKSNPQQFCEDYYNDHHIYPIILWANNLGSIYEFVPENLSKGIICPLRKTIYNILSYEAIRGDS